jgi:hypothetical protein
VAAALLSVLNYFVFSSHRQHFVKTWDVKHSYFGSKYAHELGYFRIYECMLLFDAQGPGVHTSVEAVHDLRTAHEMVPRGPLLTGSDCAARFTEERRGQFLRDLEFFDRLPRQPHAPSWFADNGYNQTPFFTALTSPLFQRAPLSYGFLLGLTFVDIFLELFAFLLVYRTFGARGGLLAAIFFLANFSNQFPAMGGSILRFGYVSFLLIGACALAARHHRSAGAAFAVASLLQIFPAFYALGVVIWAAARGARSRRLPDGIGPFCVAFAATLAVGALWGLAAVGPDTAQEFVNKLGVHNLQLSKYRVGLKLLFVLDFPVPPPGDIAYGEKVAQLQALIPLYFLCAGALLLAVASLVRKLSEVEFCLLFGTAVLYVLTPVHYYFSTLVLLFFIGGDPGRDVAGSLTRTLLFGLSAGAFLVYERPVSLALVNNYWLSIGLGVVFCAQIAALHWERRAADRGGECDPSGGVQPA